MLKKKKVGAWHKYRNVYLLLQCYKYLGILVG